MTISIIADSISIPVTHTQFNDGGSNIKLDIPPRFLPKSTVTITVEPDTNVDAYLWEIALARSAVRDYFPADADSGKIKYHLALNLPYLPHGRADRIFEVGSALPLNTFYDVVSEWFDEILLTDPHSDVITRTAAPKIWQLTIKQQYECALETLPAFQHGDVIVAPDGGAFKKTEALLFAVKHRGISLEMSSAKKIRESRTNNKVVDFELLNFNYSGKRCVIIDDIGDSESFVLLAKKIKEAGASSVELYVTHAIFAEGLASFAGVVDKIHAYQHIGSYVSRKQVQQFNNTDFTSY